MEPEQKKPPEKGSKFREHKRMLRLTFPMVKDRLMRHKRKLFFLAMLSLLLGVVPTIKSELEAAVLQQINVAVPASSDSSADMRSTPQRSFGAAFSMPLQRFTGQSSAQDGYPERLARALFRNSTLGIAVLAYLLIAVIVFATELGSKTVQAAISKDVFSKLRGEGMRRGLLTDPSALPDFNNVSGQYAVAIQQGATNVSDTYGYILEAGQHIFALATTMLLVATKSWVFALLALALVLGQVAISLRQARRLADDRTKLDRERNELVGRSENILSNREILLAYEQQHRYADKLNDDTESYAEIGRKLAVSEQKYSGFSQLLTDYGRIVILMLAIAVAFVFAGSAISNVGDAFFLIAIYARIFVPSSNLLMRYDSIKRSEATSKTFLDVLEFGPKEATSKKESEWQKDRDIEFSNVSFRYDEKAPRDVLNNCTFKIPANKTTLILGPSGSGKTTIARLLLKYWPVSRGSISIGGGDLNQFTGEELRKQMSFVSQGDHILDEPIEDNLKWGSSEHGISPERMRETLNQVGIVRPDDCDDILKFSAKKLSMGQKQRLSVARMMLDESEIVIMDEPLAGVDVFTIHDLLPHLTTLLRERKHTVIMISHRLAFAGCSDHVVILNDKGEIVEQGEPTKLAEAKSMFSELHAASIAELTLSKTELDTMQSEQPPPLAQLDSPPSSNQ